MKPADFSCTSWPQEKYKIGKEKWKKLPHRKVLSVIVYSFFAIVASVIIYYVVVPVITDILVVRMRELRNGTDSLARWERQRVPFIMNVYLWNLTNPEDVSNGISNPKFEEVGPYAYEKNTVKKPIEFKEDSIVYMETTTYHYRPDLTAPRTLDDKVVTLQVALYGAAVMVNNMAPSMMFLVEDAAPSLYPGIDSIFATVRVGDYLFDGLRLNCSDTKSSSVQMVCGALPKSAPPTLRKLPNSTDFAYSFFHHKNATENGPFEENRGMKNIRNVAQIFKYKTKSILDMWQPDSQCDQLHGTDALTFTPFITTDDKIEIFIPDICQVLPLYYQGEERLHALNVYKFALTDCLDSKETNPNNECYCVEGKETYCSKNGVRDISDCMKAPVTVSHPHFLQADAEFREYAEGSSPDKEKHLSNLFIEPLSGIPLKAAKRIQFNIPLMRINGFSLVQNVTEGLFPLMWLDEMVELDEPSLWDIRYPLLVRWIVNFILICIASLMLKICICAFISYLYLTKSCCFHHVTSNRVTALFYRPRRTSETAQTTM